MNSAKQFFDVLRFSLLLYSANLSGQRALHYDIDLAVDAQKKIIQVKAMMYVQLHAKRTDTLTFILNRNANIETVQAGNRKVDYRFYPNRQGPNRYLPDGRQLTVYLHDPLEKTVCLFFGYTCFLGDLKASASSFNDSWIELGQYSSWYPISFDYGEFTAELRSKIDSNFYVSGSSPVTEIGNNWLMKQNGLSTDIVFIASDELKSKKYKHAHGSIQLDYIQLSDQKADSIIQACQYAYQLFENTFGKIEGGDLIVTINPTKNLSSYSRKGFISMQTKDAVRMSLEGDLAHEIAHFWWNKAISSNTWQDWLNESFAEYSRLLFIKARFGLTTFLADVERYRSQSIGLPPIKNLNRASQQAGAVLYRKGPVLLYNFSARNAEGKFLDLLRAAVEAKISTTEDLFVLVEKKMDVAARQWLESEITK